MVGLPLALLSQISETETEAREEAGRCGGRHGVCHLIAKITRDEAETETEAHVTHNRT